MLHRVADGPTYHGVDNLEAMSAAVRYRRYLARCVAASAGPPAEGARLIDFGAGIGTHADDLGELGYDVTCVEVDPALRDRLEGRGHRTVVDVGGLEGEMFDVAYSFNVLEHIERDDLAVVDLFKATRPGGRLVLYVPAFPVLYSSMDRKVGHLRRYRRAPLVALVRDAGFVVDRCVYQDSLGFLASLFYRVAGNTAGDLSPRWLRRYDRYAFPVSRALDRVTGRFFGKNVLLVAHRP